MSMTVQTCRSFITFSFPPCFRQNHHQYVGSVKRASEKKLIASSRDQNVFLNSYFMFTQLKYPSG